MKTTSRRITLLLQDSHAPGLIQFLDELPPRIESAFFRALAYQWMLKNEGSPNLDKNLAKLMAGPGGRISQVVPGNAGLAPRPTVRKRARKAENEFTRGFAR